MTDPPVGNLLRAARERRGLSQRAAAAASGLSSSTLNLYERGRRTPSLTAVERVLTGLGWQLTLGLQPLFARVDAAIDELLAVPPGQRLESVTIGLDRLSESLAAGGVGHAC